jgi:hypothetical protein
MLQNQLMGFFERINADLRLTPFHISLYLALLHQWQRSSFEEHIILNKKNMQNQSRIGSAHTLYRCLNDLSAWGYIAYDVSRSPSSGSSIAIRRFYPTKVVAPKPSAAKTTDEQLTIPPDLTAVVRFFQGKGHPTVEAQKFYNHFQSNGWRVGGKSPMRNWHAAAENWILNGQNFKKEPFQQTLNLNTPKSYDEPL